MKCDFVVGQKVVCIAEDKNVNNIEILVPYVSPDIGKIYTIREVFVSNLTGDVGIKLVEIPDQRLLLRFNGHLGSGALAWSPKDFRPLTERKTDISVFKRMLTPAGGVPVDA